MYSLDELADKLHQETTLTLRPASLKKHIYSGRLKAQRIDGEFHVTDAAVADFITNTTVACVICGATFQATHTQYKCCRDPVCLKAKRKSDQRKYSKLAYKNGYKRAKSYKKATATAAKAKKRLCEGRKTFRLCKYYIDNANRYFCSYCHTKFSERCPDADNVYGGGFGEHGLSEEDFIQGGGGIIRC